MFNLNRAASAVPINVVSPKAGTTPTTVPKATVNASLCGVIPCVNRFATGVISLRLKKSIVLSKADIVSVKQRGGAAKPHTSKT